MGFHCNECFMLASIDIHTYTYMMHTSTIIVPRKSPDYLSSLMLVLQTQGTFLWEGRQKANRGGPQLQTFVADICRLACTYWVCRMHGSYWDIRNTEHGHWPLFTNKTQSYWYKDSHYKPETVIRPSQIYNGDSYTHNIAWWLEAQDWVKACLSR